MFLGSLVSLVLRFPWDDSRHLAMFAALIVGSGSTLLGALAMVAKPWPEQRLMKHAFLFFLLLYGGIVLSAIAQQMTGPRPETSDAIQLAITTLSFQGAALVLVGRLLREHELSWSQAFGFKNRWPYAMAMGGMAAVLTLPGAIGLQLGAVKGMEYLGWQPEVQQVVNLFNMTESWPDRAVLATTALALAPVAEEVLFRGLMYPALKSLGFPRLAFWTTALVFALVHFNVATFLPLVLLACILNLLYDHTGNLLSCITAHSVFNGINLLMLFASKH